MPYKHQCDALAARKKRESERVNDVDEDRCRNADVTRVWRELFSEAPEERDLPFFQTWSLACWVAMNELDAT